MSMPWLSLMLGASAPVGPDAVVLSQGGAFQPFHRGVFGKAAATQNINGTPPQSPLSGSWPQVFGSAPPARPNTAGAGFPPSPAPLVAQSSPGPDCPCKLPGIAFGVANAGIADLRYNSSGAAPRGVDTGGAPLPYFGAGQAQVRAMRAGTPRGVLPGNVVKLSGITDEQPRDAGSYVRPYLTPTSQWGSR